MADQRTISKSTTPRLTSESLSLLLGALDDRDGSQYERLRTKLIFFFARRLLAVPEDLADEVLDRLAQRLTQGTDLKSIQAFALGIARYVAQEQRARNVHVQGVDPTFWDNNVASLHAGSYSVRYSPVTEPRATRERSFEIR